MTTKHRRLSVRIMPDLNDALEELKSLTGVPPSTFASQVLSDSLPAVLKIIEAIKLAKNGDENAFSKLSELVDESVSEMGSLKSQINKHTD